MIGTGCAIMAPVNPIAAGCAIAANTISLGIGLAQLAQDPSAANITGAGASGVGKACSIAGTFSANLAFEACGFAASGVSIGASLSE